MFGLSEESDCYCPVETQSAAPRGAGFHRIIALKSVLITTSGFVLFAMITGGSHKQMGAKRGIVTCVQSVTGITFSGGESSMLKTVDHTCSTYSRDHFNVPDNVPLSGRTHVRSLIINVPGNWPTAFNDEGIDLIVRGTFPV